MEGVNRNRLFIGSCFALITTALAFAIRAGIMNDLSESFAISDTKLSWIQFMGIFGFPIATLIGGPMYNTIGPRKLGWIAFISHMAGITFSILSGSFWPLFFSTFFISFGNGMVEAAFNPMIADMYEERKAKMLNKFHVWFPGGLAIGAIAALIIGDYLGGSWQMKMAFMFIPTLIYGYLFWGQKFPEVGKNIGASTSENMKAILKSPVYWFMVVCMVFTATTELGTQGWVERILGNAGAHPLLILALVTGIMAFGRYFAGPVIKKLDITGVLLASAVISTIALFMMSNATGGMVYVAAILFAIGVCYFWPNMISFVADYLPKTGALGMSLIGGIGMVGVSIFQPVIGYWIDGHRNAALSSGLDSDAAELAAGQATLANIALLPAMLIVAFGIIYFMRKSIKENNQLETT